MPQLVDTTRRTDFTIGYCTNVHPGNDLATTYRQLEQHAVAVRRTLGWPRMGVGLWLSRSTATELLTHESTAGAANVASVAKLAEWMSSHGLVPYTLNGFPYGNFHNDVVKHEVYLPSWADEARWEYTVDLAKLFAQLLSATAQDRGTISTLPLGWNATTDTQFFEQAAHQLHRLAEALESLEERTGRRIEVCLEPEPGCTLGSMAPMVEFFTRYLFNGDERLRQRNSRYLSVCYDICHAGVMHESSLGNVQLLQAAGVRIGKVQVSSALEIDFERLTSEERDRAWVKLQSFSEPRYLHQTVVYQSGRPPRFFEDLPWALQDPTVRQQGCWTVHFHVPISEPKAGELGTTQSSIHDFIEAAFQANWLPQQWEVETYAWNVLPRELQAESLAVGIAKEVAALDGWLRPYMVSSDRSD
ncbi:MAG: metabolite traffic protein EboE [Planctomycetaceae bacterium]|nr:metabolite traffic protein EboE [Planctomycetaceae bacterium]